MTTTSTPASTPPTPEALATQDLLSDIFGDGQDEPTDLKRLRVQHNTAGYRAGISAGKAQKLQKGFDEGYGLGATFGLRIGQILGSLETLPAKTCGDLLGRARTELALDEVFGARYFTTEGLWNYQVPTKDENDSTFHDVVTSHPAVSKWELIVQEEMEKAGVRKGIFAGNEWEAGRIED